MGQQVDNLQRQIADCNRVIEQCRNNMKNNSAAGREQWKHTLGQMQERKKNLQAQMPIARANDKRAADYEKERIAQEKARQKELEAREKQRERENKAREKEREKYWREREKEQAHQAKAEPAVKPAAVERRDYYKASYSQPAKPVVPAGPSFAERVAGKVENLEQLEKEVHLYSSYCSRREDLYSEHEKDIKAHKNIKPSEFTAYYKKALYWQWGPRPVQELEQLAAQYAPQINSSQKRAGMDGKLDVTDLYKAECERLEKLVMRYEEFRNYPEIRQNFPELCNLADNSVQGWQEAEKYQPLFMLLCAIYAIVWFIIVVNPEMQIGVVVLPWTACGFGLYYYYKKFNLEKCLDWNVLNVWKRFLASRKK